MKQLKTHMPYYAALPGTKLFSLQQCECKKERIRLGSRSTNNNEQYYIRL